VISSVVLTKKIAKDDSINELCKISLDKMIEFQNDDGSWYYSYYYDGHIYRQLDFHQGFIINGLIDSMEMFPEKQSQIRKTIEKAVKTYDSIFLEDGRGYYRYPRRYPIDIHNQAQGIITYLKLYKIFNDERYINMSKKICKWTIKNMQDIDGHFYYQKGRLVTNRIPYMRWSQAWMMLALSQILGLKR